MIGTRQRLIVAAFALWASTVLAADAGDYAPQNIERTYKQLHWQCMLHMLCPVSDEVYDVIKRALANDRSAQYLLGLTLLTGDGLPRDRQAGVAWIGHAAELGEPAASREIASRLRNGESIDVDETKIANALLPQANAGDAEAMRALGPMYIGGRGVKRDPAAGLALMQRAAAAGSSGAETDLAQLYLNGAPGVPASRPEALKWLAASASHGNREAMLHLGYMSMNMPVGVPSTERDLASAYCWLMRAALLDQAQAQEKLSMIFAQGEKDVRGTVIEIDLVQADLWFRIAARSPYHDNPQIRAMIEPQMTTEQINEAKRLFQAWHPRTVQELRAMTISLPGATPRQCPPMA